MARQSGKVIDFAYNSVSIEDELSNLSMSVDVNLPEVTAFGDAASTFVEGLPSTTIDVSGFFDPAASQGDATIYTAIGSGANTALLETTGAAAGTNSPTYSVSAFVSNYTLTSDVGGATTYSASFQGSGANTRAVS
tara:strand:- start:625 stop:1032 length:408 start_codon:yes stop_codon:yes gene_type:complete